MEDSLALRVMALFVTLFASLCGVGIPIYMGKSFSAEAMKSHFGFSVLRTFSAGIMVGVAFIHLLGEASHALPEVYPDYEALPFTLACLGIIFVLVLENVMLTLIKPSNSVHEPVNFHAARSRDEEGNEDDDAAATSPQGKHAPPVGDCDGKFCKDLASVGQDVVVASAAVKFHQKDQTPPLANCHHSHTHVTMNLLADSKSFLVLIKAYMMELAIAIHSVIIGVSMGMMGPDEISPLRALIIAVVFHQFFEGIGLGAVLSYVRMKLGAFKVFMFAIIFGATISIGIAIGMGVSFLEEVDDHTHEFVTGCANSISAGTLIYVAMVEMMADEFSNQEIAMKMTQKFAMIGSFSFGVFVMAILAMWA